ncbi:MAG: glycosyltransferase family 4 protein, partial [Janthinobacterium lividum]
PSPWLNRYTAMVQSGLMSADAVVAPTRWMLQALKPNFFMPNGGHVIPNGRSMARSTSHGAKQLQAVTAGRLWDEAKGLDLLKQCNLPIPVLIAGETRFQEEAADLQSAANLQSLGTLEPEQMQAAFQKSAIYLCTSRYEPFGLAPLEAALCGCAIIARDLPSLREVWGDAALYFQDAASLVAQVRALAESPAALSAAQERAFERASLYPVSRMTDAYLSLFENVLQRRGVVSDAA